VFSIFSHMVSAKAIKYGLRYFSSVWPGNNTYQSNREDIWRTDTFK